MQIMNLKLHLVAIAMGICASMQAQVNSGSDGSDGALDYSAYINGPYNPMVIDMHDHPNGVYQYTSVNISSAITIKFSPNANNTPVTWLVQSNVIINGIVDVSGHAGSNNGIGGSGGPGGYIGGGGGSTPAPPGQGPGGGSWSGGWGANANYDYGNIYLVPLLGGSGGGGGYSSAGGGGGGGAIIIAASGQFSLTGQVLAHGGDGVGEYRSSGPNAVGGGGSGGAIRIIATKITGSGSMSTAGGGTWYQNGSGGQGRVRFDTFENDFAGSITGTFTQGYQPIIIPTTGQGSQLKVASVGGVPVSVTPTGQLTTPDTILSAQQNNPIPVVVSCANVPLNTQITVSVKPTNGAAVNATGYNTTGTLAASTATISIVIPRGGGLIYVTAATSN